MTEEEKAEFERLQAIEERLKAGLSGVYAAIEVGGLFGQASQFELTRKMLVEILTGKDDEDVELVFESDT